MTIKEQAAYLKGMLSGLDLDEESGETKLLKGIVDLLHNMSISFEDLEEDMDGVLEQLEVMDEDLSAVECKLGGNSCKCCDCDDNDNCYEVICPKCDEKICLCEDSLLDEEMNCPNCGELLEFDLEELGNECCCDCGCDCGDECNCDENCSCDCDESCECHSKKSKDKK